MVDKFRVWDNRTKSNRFFNFQNFKIISTFFEGQGKHRYDEIEQSTGLFDIEGTEIYEGDFFISSEGERYIIVWLNEWSSFLAINQDYYQKFKSGIIISDYDFHYIPAQLFDVHKIIGSIRDPKHKSKING